MSLYPILWAAEHAPVRDAEERAILIALVMKGDFDGCNCFRSYGTLAKVARVDTKTAGRRCREMESRGILRRQTEHRSRSWLSIPEEQRPVIWEVMIPADFWSAVQLADINEQRAALGRHELTRQNRPALPEAPPKKARADKGAKRPKKVGQAGDLGACSPEGDPGTSSPHPRDFQSPPPGLVVPLPSESPSESPSENNRAVADAVGNGAGGFASAGADDGATGETGEAGSGCAASEPSLPTQRTTSPRPATTKTKPRTQPAGFESVRAAIPAAVAAPGTRLAPMLHRAINDLLDGNPSAGIAARTPEQVIARLNRRWYGEQADRRAAADYRGCDACTASGCSAVRRSLENPGGCDRIKNRNSWLAAALLAQNCPDPSCEDGVLIGGGGPCRACRARSEEARQAARAANEAAARWESETGLLGAERAAVDAWAQEEAAEERRLRDALGKAGAYGQLLDHKVRQHMSGWRDRHPRPTPSREATSR